MNERYHGGRVPGAIGGQLGSAGEGSYYQRPPPGAAAAYQQARRREYWLRIGLGSGRWVALSIWALILIAAFLGGLKNIADEGINCRIYAPHQKPAGAHVRALTLHRI